MITIHKYPLNRTPLQVIRIPGIPQILKVDLDAFGNPCIWAKVNTTLRELLLEVHMVGTGREVPAGANHYVGTYKDGPDIAHIFIT